ncbi:SH3 domain-containing protein [Litorilinea aerophila]|nr:SH3 domain-containing protein [Litorilinea aerophila]MCC9077705.1 SH3 domain-containing protein [Litorilinea aerophila]
MTNQSVPSRWSRTRQGRTGRIRLVLALPWIALLALAPYGVLWGQSPTPQETTRESGTVGARVAVAGAQGVVLADTPGQPQGISLEAGTLLSGLGRTADGEWLRVQTSEGMVGWVPTSGVIAFGVTGWPVFNEDGTLAATPTQEDRPAAGNRRARPGNPAQPENGATADATVQPPAPVVTSTAPIATPTVVAPVATPEAVPAATDASPVVTATVTLTDSRLNVRAGPGLTYPIIAKAHPGEVYVALARDADGDWIQLGVPSVADGFGWVSREFMALSQPWERLPVSAQVSTASTSATISAAASSGQATTLAASPTATPSTASTSAATGGLSGKLVFQNRLGEQIYVYDFASGALWPLTTGIDPTISPDGQTVAFTREGGEAGLYLIDIDGQNERRIYVSGFGLRSPSWSPDGRYIVFSRGVEGDRCRQINERICLSDDEALSDFPLVTQRNWVLSRVDVNGQEYRDIPSLLSARNPDWNQAGIVYESDSGIQITQDAPSATSQLVAFDIHIQYYQDPDWQPNGGRILFQRREASHWEIFSVNPDGADLVALTRPATVLVDALPSNVAPAWSPDGQHIVFLSNRDEGNNAGAWRLWVMEADGSNQRPLPIDVPLEYSFTGEQMVDWGP